MTLEEFTAFVHALWNELPHDLRASLRQCGIAIAVSEEKPDNAMGICYRHGDIVIFYGWLKDSDRNAIRRVFLHEVAHACGFNHPNMPQEVR